MATENYVTRRLSLYPTLLEGELSLASKRLERHWKDALQVTACSSMSTAHSMILLKEKSTLKGSLNNTDNYTTLSYARLIWLVKCRSKSASSYYNDAGTFHCFVNSNSSDILLHQNHRYTHYRLSVGSCITKATHNALSSRHSGNYFCWWSNNNKIFDIAEITVWNSRYSILIFSWTDQSVTDKVQTKFTVTALLCVNNSDVALLVCAIQWCPVFFNNGALGCLIFGQRNTA